MHDKYTKPYDHETVESDIYKIWEDSGYFNPDKLPGERTENYSIIMPPPNANGSLHAGHALFVTVQDILIRYNRMQGKKVLWQPGADHAGFETQVVYEKKLQKEGRSRFDLSCEELYKEILDFTLENKSFMEGQIRDLGASCDWSRQLFTLDERVVGTVYDTFQKLSDDGLLYRGMRSVNWCPKHQTAFSNLEINYDERVDKFYYFQYGPFVIGTARPETKFGDKYVVMHPEDERYAEYEHGQKIDIEWINGPLTATVIKDEAGDPEMGSGVMTITPWHSAVDFDIAQRHDLDYEQIIDERGKLLSIAEEFDGMPITEAREKIVAKLKDKGLLVKVDEKYEHSVPTCYKCSRDIEPQLKQQWFITMQPLAQKAIDAITKEDVAFVTERHKRIALHWLENLEDWNISRQIVWGIPIPAKICIDCDHGMVDLDDTITACAKCDGANVVQDTDTFDTWFSSGQWPFITLNYPDGQEYKDFYPTSVMETGSDILMFWVLRMIMLGLYVTKDVPFKTVYLHGLVRDKKGQKMSKSKGNVTAPAELSEQYGTDALRMGLTIGNTPGTDMNLDPQKVNAYKKFANKLWNVTRFVYSNADDFDFDFDQSTLTDAEHKRLTELADLKEDITKDIDEYRIYMAAEKIYHYIWHTVADQVLEESKEALFDKTTPEEKVRKIFMLLTILEGSLKMLHPFMPFITEEIWKDFPKKDKDLLLVERW